MPPRQRKTEKLSIKIALMCAGAGAAMSTLSAVFVVQTLSSAISNDYAAIVTRGWIVGLSLAAITGVVVGVVAWFQGTNLASRLTELGIGVAKIGRGSSEVRVRYSGGDEVAALGRAIQYLASDIAQLHQEAEQGGGLAASMDPLIREMRDMTLPDGLSEFEGYELDGVLLPGSRGGLDYFDCVADEHSAVLFLVGSDGVGTTSAIAARMARDELLRALKVRVNARKALSHTNRVMHRELPQGVCARACLLSLTLDSVKLYQAGIRSPLLVCSAGRVGEINAEGLALGLDEGPVFEKGLRSTAVPVSQGVRLVLANEAALRLDEFTDLVAEHSAKHTAPFMNLVSGTLEASAGEGGLREDVVMLTAKRW